MYLEKLEAIGFKSFAEKTEFNFERGLTAVVGPNGCGKSNLVDAFKWVLGEQSVKALRGSEMTDVIFNGTTHRKPLGYSEVSLTFSNTKNILPVDYDQVCVTRRLYRTGESEYFLNKSKCRLRDVRELFMGTGVGTNCYSVIEQGKIDVLLQANPQERRTIFEEAAGISKYKAKKKIALNKLNRVEQNLLRLSDIIAEVQKQMRSLHRQAGKARRFRDYSFQLKDLKNVYSRYRYQILTKDYEQLCETVKNAEAKHGLLRATIEGFDAEASRLATNAIDIDQSLRAKETLRIEINNQIQGCEGVIQRANDRLQEAELSKTRYLQEIERSKERLQTVEAELLEANNELEATEADLENSAKRIEENTGRLHELTGRASELGHKMQNLRTGLMDIYNERNRYENERTALERDQELLSEQMKRAMSRRSQIEQDLAGLGLLRRDNELEIGKLASSLETNKAQLGNTIKEIDTLEESLVQLDSTLGDARQNLSSKESRQRVLQDLERRREGMGAGAKQVLNASQDQLQGIVGTVAELFEVDVKFAIAIEAALENAAQMIVTKNTDDTQAAIDFLRKEDRGRATFLPINRARPKGNGLPPIKDHPSYLGRASEFIRVKESHRDFLGHLLSGTHIVKDFQAAFDLAPQFPPSARLVTLDGDIASSAGPITGGGAVNRMGIISRKSELRQLEGEITGLRQVLEELVGERNHATQRLQTFRKERETLQETLTDINIQLSQRRTTLEQILRDIADAQQEDMLLASEATDHQNQLSKIGEQCERLVNRIGGTEEREALLKSEHSDLEKSQNEVEKHREAVREELSELQATISGLREKLHALKNARQGCIRTLQEQKDILHSRQCDIEQCDERLHSAKEAIQSSKQKLENLFIERKQQEEEIRVEHNRREEVRALIGKNSTELRETNHEFRGQEERIRDFQVKKNELGIRRENLIEQTLKELGIDLAQSEPENSEVEVAEGEVEVTEAEPNWDEIHEQIRVLEKRILNLGNVYEDAIEEYEKLELRAETLMTQEQDLVEAKKKLQQIIRKINRTSRRLFETTFTAVRENFRELFAKLFGGGKADIFLEEGVDILEAGIEIVARPPGKSENTVLSLLSGGEKALCTVALLFAIFRSRPSPFCILDEVDAPLDESNIDRFVSIVQEFNANTQFLIITHNRRTMRSADLIYGITMQEPGVSSKVSVRFEDTENY